MLLAKMIKLYLVYIIEVNKIQKTLLIVIKMKSVY